MYSVIPRKRRLEEMIEARGRRLMFRQWFHSINGLIASFVSIVFAFNLHDKSNFYFAVCCILYSYAHLLWAINVRMKVQKFKRQIEGYEKLCGVKQER